MKVVVTGSRDATDRDFVFQHLDVWDGRIGPIHTVVHGAARGVDTLAQSWAVARGRQQVPYPADWSTGKGAGPARNREMLKEMPDFVIAFDGGKGTENCVDQARRLGLRVIEIVGKV